MLSHVIPHGDSSPAGRPTGWREAGSRYLRDCLRIPAVRVRRREKGEPSRMTHFLGTHQNRLDAKGRVSVPAPFRAVIRALNGTAEPESAGQNGAPVVLRPSHKHPCIEAWPASVFRQLATPLERLDLFSEEHDDLAAALYADAFPVDADKEGRIILPEGLVAHAGLTDAVVFMGLGRTFQIWEPAAAERRRAEARERARSRGMTLPGAPAAGVGFS
jgi:MraZ protein